ncbi:MAG TPA: hypothetical protein VF980_09480 [Thermoanaerobaculia bacterium]
MSDWNVEVNRRPYRVTVTAAPNGKMMVRANGRIVAPPQPPGTLDCWFNIETDGFHLHGSAEQLRLDPVVVQVEKDNEPEREPAPAPDLPSAERVQWRVVTFMTVGVLLFLLSSCSAVFVTTVALRFSTMEIAAPAGTVFSDPAVENSHGILGAIRAGCILEAFVGVAAIAGAALLLRGHKLAPIVLEGVCWAIVGVAIIAVAAVDVLSHRQLVLAYQPQAALRWLSIVHFSGGMMLVLLGVASGWLISFLEPDALAAQLASRGETGYIAPS